MRLIGTLKSEFEVARILSFLKQKGIEIHTDLIFNATGEPMHQIWVLEEDRITEAVTDFQRFIKAPTDAAFDASLSPDSSSEEEAVSEEKEEAAPLRAAKTPFTLFILALSCAIFFLNYLEELPMREENLSSLFLFTPIQATLLYDLPSPFEQVAMFVEEHPVVPNQQIQNLEPAVLSQVEQLERAPYFRGGFDWLLLKLKKEDPSLAEGPLFIKIRQGEIWRLFSPAILHTQFLHILFNMIWLWVLGRPIEQRIGWMKTTILTAAIALGSNALQYLAGGPFFIGYSGVVMGLAGFIWMRQRRCPWEGYPINTMTFLFLFLFVVSIFCLSFVSFFLELWANVSFAPNIANTAHIVGGVMGICLGRLSWFTWHPTLYPSKLPPVQE